MEASEATQILCVLFLLLFRGLTNELCCPPTATTSNISNKSGRWTAVSQGTDTQTHKIGSLLNNKMIASKYFTFTTNNGFQLVGVSA